MIPTPIPALEEVGCHCCGMLCLASPIEDYRQCMGCRSWRSMKAASPETLYTDDYWSHARGHSTLDEQWRNLTLPMYVEEPFVTAWVRRAVAELPSGSRVLEIGCSPGAFLFTMAVRGYAVHGQEAAEGVCQDIAKLTGLPRESFTAGLFPQVAPPGSFDMIAAFDVIEHAPDPAVWLQGALDRLSDGGVLLLQTPVFDPDDPSEINEDSRGMWHPEEHVYVFTPKGISRLLQRCGHSGEYSSERLAPGHDLITVHKS